MHRCLLILFVIAGLALGAPLQAQITVRFQNSYLEHNVFRSGQKGMLLHVRFSIQNARGIRCFGQAVFYDATGRPLQSLDPAFRRQDGTMCAVSNFVPDHDSVVFTDFSLFAPYRALPITGNQQRFQVNFGVYQENPLRFIGGTDRVEFTFGTGAEEPPPRRATPPPNGPSPTEEVTINFYESHAVNHITEDGLPGFRIHVAFDVDNGLNGKFQLVAYIQDEEGRKIKASDARYSSPGGTVAVAVNVVPRHLHASFGDFKVFVPFEAFARPVRESRELTYYFSLTDMRGNRIGRSSKRYSFTLAGP
jgi:hypothetical protein